MPLKPTALLTLLGALLTLAGCRATIGELNNAAYDVVSGYSTRNMLVMAGVGAAAYYALDPLAPNWEVSQQQINDTRYRIALRMKRFHAGGEGEAESLFTRHAEELAEQWGAGEYRLLSYREGIDSEVTVPRRWAQGVIELLPAQRPARAQRTASR